MKKVKIMVWRNTVNEDFVKDYAMPALKKCSVKKERQVFMAGLGKIDGMCDLITV